MVYLMPIVYQDLEAKGYNIEIVDGKIETEPDIDLIILCLGANDMLSSQKKQKAI